ncbi:periplasmic heavy metal sensor [Burkholderia alba]|uniref:periplasmic heavy metal sensor n=1 Tax=Burkholderia alba TaxID=2683677 RepID=UPI002B060C55|nr:periplasmic heavy metal sensor [Burkholderia alba]
MYKKTSRVAIAAAAVLALTFGAAARAQTADAPPAGPAAHQPWHGGHEGGPFMMMKRLHDKLNLSAAQEQQWQAAVGTMKQNGEAMRKNHEQLRQQFQAQQNQPILDMNALHAARQQVEQQNAQLREQSSAAWLSFYNGLNDQQKTTVSTAFKERMAKMAQRREKMKQHWQQHRAAQGASASAPAQPQ